MASQINDYPLIVDIGERRLLHDVQSNYPQESAKSVIQGDELRLTIRAVRLHPRVGIDPTKLWQDVQLPSQIYAGIVLSGSSPESGTFTLTFGADTTSALAYNISAANLQTALNALASITSAGGVVVTGDAGGPWQINFNTAGARSAITGNGDNVFPASQVNIYTERDGTVSLTEIQVISLELLPVALCDTFTDFPSAAVTITELQAGASGVPCVQRITINDDTYDGTFTVEFDGDSTSAIPYNSTAAELQAYLEALTTIGPDNVVVTGEFPTWTVNFQGTLTGDQPTMTGSAAGLIVPIGKVGTLNLSTAGIERLVSGKSSASAIFEIQAMYGGSSPATILHTEITVINDGIPSSPGLPVDLPSYLTETASDGRYPRYDAATTYDSGEKAQFKSNLGFGTFADKSSLDASDIGSGAITTAKIADLNVTTGKLADNAVTTAKITDANVTTAKLADNAITTVKITDANVTAAKIASDAVTTAKILDANVTAAKLATDAVTTAKIADGAVTSAKLESVVTAATNEIYTATYDAKGRITAVVSPIRETFDPLTITGISGSTADYDVMSLTIPANTIKAGDFITFEMHGATTNSTTASNFQTWFKVDGTKSTVTSFAMGTTAASSLFVMRGVINFYQVGVSGNLRGSFFVNWKTSQSGTPNAAFSFNTTGARTIIVGANQSAATGTSIVVYNGFIRLN